MYLLWGGACGTEAMERATYECTTLKISTKTVEVQGKTDGMGINTYRHHVGTIQNNIECEKSEFCHLPSCNLLIPYKPRGALPLMMCHNIVT
jgi:hypothetical protein